MVKRVNFVMSFATNKNNLCTIYIKIFMYHYMDYLKDPEFGKKEWTWWSSNSYSLHSISVFEHRPLKYPVWWNDARRAILSRVEADSSRKEKQLCYMRGPKLDPLLFFFLHRAPFSLERTLIHRLWLFKLDYLAEFSGKWTNESCHFQENNWQYLLPMIKFKLSRILKYLYQPPWAWQLSKT